MTVIFGFVLDLIFGDPKWIYHPVCAIGSGINFFERKIREKFPKTESGEKVGGAVLLLIITTLCFFVPAFIIWSIGVFAPIITIFFAYQIFATKSLKQESMKVFTALKGNDLMEARRYLSYIVGRDTTYLDEKEIIKATVETIAENLSDGVIAPMIYMAMGGVPLAFLYKGINTLDSMVGYKNEKYLYFGRASAVADDIANFIPSRISALLMLMASFFMELDYKNAAKIFKRDRLNHKSPNSAQTESVCAGALNVQLGGNSYYFGKLCEKQTIGDNNRDINVDDIKKTNDLMVASAVIGVIFLAVINFI